MKIAIVGAGVAGLAAAVRLREVEPAADIVVIEQSDRPGGKLRTGQLTGVDGSPVPVELGAENFLVRDPATGDESAAVRLARRFGLGDDLVHPATGNAALAVDRRLRPLPRGTLMGIPSQLELVDDVAKLAVERDTDDGRPLLAPGQDVAVGELVRKRLGDQVVDRLVDPLLGGVYAGRADLLSLAATIPGLAAAATSEHTLIGAVRAAIAASAAHRPAPAEPADGGGAPARGASQHRPQPVPAVFATVAGGVERLVQAMAAQVPVRLGLPARELRRTGSRWTLVLGPVPRPQLVEADAVVLAVPARPAARLLADVAPAAAAEVGALDYASVALVALALPAVELPELSGLLVPAGEGFAVKAATFFTRKWPHLRRADGTVLVRASLGRYGEEHVLQRDDASLTALVLGELSTLLGRRLPDPVDSLVQRWGGALPQYAPGHLDRVARARSALRSAAGARGTGAGGGVGLPPLALAGAAYDGVGIPACLRSGEAAADEIITALRSSPR
jgi:oxygen-dependent protoporphyrinogen oxidase